MDWVQRRLVTADRWPRSWCSSWCSRRSPGWSPPSPFRWPRRAPSSPAQLPHLSTTRGAGRAPSADLLDRTNSLQYVQHPQAQLRSFASGPTTPAVGVLRGVATGIAGALTDLRPGLPDGPRGPEDRRRHDRPCCRRTARSGAPGGSDCARSITGYLSGNLLISVICGALTYGALKIAGVPFAGLISLFVAIADLIPLVGATLGAVVAVIAAFVHSVPAGIACHLLHRLPAAGEPPAPAADPLPHGQPQPAHRAVAILVAVELAGILGALLAIPITGMIQVILRDLWDNRRGRPKAAPTVGEDEHPADGDGVPSAELPVSAPARPASADLPAQRPGRARAQLQEQAVAAAARPGQHRLPGGDAFGRRDHEAGGVLASPTGVTRTATGRRSPSLVRQVQSCPVGRPERAIFSSGSVPGGRPSRPRRNRSSSGQPGRRDADELPCGSRAVSARRGWWR